MPPNSTTIDLTDYIRTLDQKEIPEGVEIWTEENPTGLEESVRMQGYFYGRGIIEIKVPNPNSISKDVGARGIYHSFTPERVSNLRTEVKSKDFGLLVTLDQAGEPNWDGPGMTHHRVDLGQYQPSDPELSFNADGWIWIKRTRVLEPNFEEAFNTGYEILFK